MAKKQIEVIEDAKWLLAFLQVRNRSGPIIHDLSQAEGKCLPEQKMAAL